MHVPGPLRTPASSKAVAQRGEALLGLAHVLWRLEARADGLVEAHAMDADLETGVLELVDRLGKDGSDRAWDGVSLLVRPPPLAAIYCSVMEVLRARANTSTASCGGVAKRVTRCRGHRLPAPSRKNFHAQLLRGAWAQGEESCLRRFRFRFLDTSVSSAVAAGAGHREVQA